MIAGCASPQGAFPTLERRPFESNVPVEAPIVPPTPVASSLPAEMASKVARLRTQFAKASSDYAAMLPAVRNAANAASSAGVGSEAWVSAQLRVSRLDKARSGAVAALAEMDDLIVAQRDAESQGAIILLVPLLEPVQAEMAASVAKQNQDIDRFSKIIGL